MIMRQRQYSDDTRSMISSFVYASSNECDDPDLAAAWEPDPVYHANN
jgi:hypothetical protein